MDIMNARLHRSRALVIFSVVIAALAQLAGCAGIAHRQHVRDGLLNTGLEKGAFLDTWGQPDKTSVRNGEDVTTAHAARGGESLNKSKGSYEVWEYNRYGTALVFSGAHLVNWSTTKSKEELQRICRRDPVCRRK